MKTPCPDLVGMSDSELTTFWTKHQPENLKNLGDRLLKECLPRFAPRGENFYPADLANQRQAIPTTLPDMARRLSVTAALLNCWEQGELRPPASLALIYDNLRSAKSGNDVKAPE